MLDDRGRPQPGLVLPSLETPPDLPEASVSTRRSKRPTPVTFVGVLALAAGAYHLASGVVTIVRGSGASGLSEAWFELALGLVALAIARGLLRMAPWSWTAVMTWAVVGLTNELLRHFFYDHVDYGAMAVDAILVLALTPRDIQVAFGVRPRPVIVLESNPRDRVQRN
jgi:hypothetical protein